MKMYSGQVFVPDQGNKKENILVAIFILRKKCEQNVSNFEKKEERNLKKKREKSKEKIKRGSRNPYCIFQTNHILYMELYGKRG